MHIRIRKIIKEETIQDVFSFEDAEKTFHNLELIRDKHTVIEIWDGKKLIKRTRGKRR